MSTDPPLPVDASLRLPPGRLQVTWSEFSSTWGFNVHRLELLAEAQRFVNTLASVLPVCAVWIGGSYLTDKGNPGDLDMSVVLNTEDIHTDVQRQLATVPGLQQLARALGVRVDAYLLNWHPRVSNRTGEDDRAELTGRGYWDDWWMRERQVPKTEAATRECALPRRGYVEVIVNGYR